MKKFLIIFIAICSFSVQGFALPIDQALEEKDPTVIEISKKLQESFQKTYAIPPYFEKFLNDEAMKIINLTMNFIKNKKSKWAATQKAEIVKTARLIDASPCDEMEDVYDNYEPKIYNLTKNCLDTQKMYHRVNIKYFNETLENILIDYPSAIRSAKAEVKKCVEDISTNTFEEACRKKIIQQFPNSTLYTRIKNAVGRLVHQMESVQITMSICRLNQGDLKRLDQYLHRHTDNFRNCIEGRKREEKSLNGKVPTKVTTNNPKESSTVVNTYTTSKPMSNNESPSKVPNNFEATTVAVPSKIAPEVETTTVGVPSNVAPKVETTTAGVPSKVAPEVETTTVGVPSNVAPEVETTSAGVPPKVAPEVETTTAGVPSNVAPEIEAPNTPKSPIDSEINLTNIQVPSTEGEGHADNAGSPSEVNHNFEVPPSGIPSNVAPEIEAPATASPSVASENNTTNIQMPSNEGEGNLGNAEIPSEVNQNFQATTAAVPSNVAPEMEAPTASNPASEIDTTNIQIPSNVGGESPADNAGSPSEINHNFEVPPSEIPSNAAPEIVAPATASPSVASENNTTNIQMPSNESEGNSSNVGSPSEVNNNFEAPPAEIPSNVAPEIETASTIAPINV